VTGRLLYLAAGAVLGGYVVHRVNRARSALTPGGIADRVEGRVSEYRGALQELNEDLAEAVRQEDAELLRRYEPARRALRASDAPSRRRSERE
jgi:phage protein U